MKIKSSLRLNYLTVVMLGKNWAADFDTFANELLLDI